MGESMPDTGVFRKRYLGISTHIKENTVEEMAAVAKEVGVSYLEIVAERFWNLPNGGGKRLWKEIKDLLSHNGLRPIVHSSYIEINLSSINRHLREAALRQTLRCLEFAAFLGADYLVIHPGNLNRNYPAAYLHEAHESLLDSLVFITQQAESVGLSIALENGWNGENHPIIRDGDEHVEIIERVSRPGLKAFFDIGHANTFDVDLSAYVDHLQPYLAGIHLHDNRGTRDEHLPLGKGDIAQADFKHCFDAGVPVVLEMNSLEDLWASIAYLEENITSF